MALNLVRNSKVYFTTNLDSNNRVASTGFTPSNTQEIQVLDGFTFSQGSNSEVVTIMEGGATPTRGQRAFNTSLAPVDFAFSTYLRPRNATTSITAEESVLWNALLSDQPIPAALTNITGVSAVTYAFNNTTGVGTVTITGTAMATLPAVGDVVTLAGIATTTPAGFQDRINTAGTVLTSSATSITIKLASPFTTAITATTLTTANTVRFSRSAWVPVSSTYSYISTAGSEKHQLQRFGMIFIVDQVAYAVDNAAMGEVTVDFGLEAITTGAWKGQGTTLRQLGTGVTANAGTFGNGLTGTYAQKVTDAGYITNKLSTVGLTLVNSLRNTAGVAQGTAGDSYTIPLTGGSITISNNITYLTPANLGVVNLPVAYYTGARSVTGTITAYLRTGGVRDTGELLADMLNAASATIEPMTALSISMGGASIPRVVFDMPSTVIQVPTINVQQVVTTEIKFTAQSMVPNTTADSNIYDLTELNEISIRYFA